MRTGENIFKRKDGRWEARYHKGRDASGRLQYGFCYGKTYAEAKMKVEQAKLACWQWPNESVHSKRKVFAFYCDAWLQVNQVRLRASTYVKYQTVLEKYIKPHLGGLFPEEIQDQNISLFSGELLDAFKLAPKTVKDILLILHAVLRYTEKQLPGKMAVIEIAYPKEPRQDIRVLSVVEQKTLTEYLLTDLDSCKFGVLLAMWTGIRIGELCALRWDHILLENKLLRIDASMQRLKDCASNAISKTTVITGPPKSLSSIRIIPLTDSIIAICNRIRPENTHAYLLTGTEHYMEPRTLQGRFRKYATACMLSDVHFHTLRHTFATRCIESGFELKALSEVMGHASTAVTINRYVHCSIDLKRQNMEKLQHQIIS